MSMLKNLLTLLPQPGEDWKSWAIAMTNQLQTLLPQLVSNADLRFSGSASAPLYQDDGTTVVVTGSGEYKLSDGTVVVDALGLHVYDAVGFQVINGPTIRIDTTHLVDAAVETAKLAAGAVTETTIASDAITAPKIAANAIVAGKIAANAIVAGDAVIANGAIVDAQIANLNAGKINAGDISAARMETNIVTALNGKFATLSALAASLGVVQIQAGGALFTQGVTTYSSGTGIWMGENSGAYKFRVGNPNGSRFDWNGATLSIYNSANQLVLESGESFLRANLAHPLSQWTHNGSNWVYTSSPWTFDGSTLVIPDGSNLITSDAPSIALSASNFTISFKAWSSVAGRVLHVDLFPNTLPESAVALTTSPTVYSFPWSSSHADLANCHLRFFAEAQAGQIEVGDIMLTYGLQKAAFQPHRNQSVNVWNKIASGNVSTYIASAAIGFAYIQKGNIFDLTVSNQIKSDNYVGGSVGWTINRDGGAEFRNVTVRGDVQATSLQAGTAMVGTLHIQGNAVTIPASAYTAGAQLLNANGGVYTNVQSIYIDAGGSPVFLIASARCVGIMGLYTMRILAPSGAVVVEGAGSIDTGNPGTVSMAITATSSQVGTYTLQITKDQFSTNSFVYNSSLCAIGVKR